MMYLKTLDVERIVELTTACLAANADLAMAVDLLQRQSTVTNLRPALTLARIAMTTATYLNNEMICAQRRSKKQHPAPAQQSAPSASHKALVKENDDWWKETAKEIARLRTS